jgi:hypothetical protein
VRLFTVLSLLPFIKWSYFDWDATDRLTIILPLTGPQAANENLPMMEGGDLPFAINRPFSQNSSRLFQPLASSYTRVSAVALFSAMDISSFLLDLIRSRQDYLENF